MEGISYAIENPYGLGIASMIADLNEEIDSMTPAEFNEKLNLADLARMDVFFLVARHNRNPVACGALKLINENLGEIKRFYTNPKFRGQGISSKILSRLIEIGKRSHLTKIVLETGVNYDSAIALYKKHGFAQCGPYLHYKDNPYSYFMVKNL